MIISYHTDPEIEFPYAIRVPKNWRTGLPIIFQLHGAGERGERPEQVEVHGFANILTEAREVDCILIQPQCPEGTFWVAQIPKLLQFIKRISEKYQCDQDQVYLTGLSMGGYGTWYTAMAYPEMFAAIAPCCGGGMAWNAGVLTMPVWAFHGAQDDVVAVEETLAMVKAIWRSGGNVRMTIYDDCGHDAWNKAYSEELLQWLLNQKRSTKM